MKNYVVGFLIGIMLLVGGGAWVAGQYSALSTVQHGWTACGGNVTGTTAGVYTIDITDPNTVQRDAVTMEAAFQHMDLDGRWNTCIFRNSSTTDGDVTVYTIYGKRDNTVGDYAALFKLTFTTGAQHGVTTKIATPHLADTLVETTNYWLGTGEVSSPTGDFVAFYARDIRGIKTIAIVPDVTTGHSAFLEITGY